MISLKTMVFIAVTSTFSLSVNAATAGPQHKDPIDVKGQSLGSTFIDLNPGSDTSKVLSDLRKDLVRSSFRPGYNPNAEAAQEKIKLLQNVIIRRSPAADEMSKDEAFKFLLNLIEEIEQYKGDVYSITTLMFDPYFWYRLEHLPSGRNNFFNRLLLALRHVFPNLKVFVWIVDPSLVGTSREWEPGLKRSIEILFPRATFMILSTKGVLQPLQPARW